MRLNRVLAPLVAALLLMGSSAALAEADRVDPERGPKTEGPLTLEDTACDERAVKSDDGDVLGRAEVCLYLYKFDTLSENDLLQEHGAAWLQARFTPVDGWCVTDLTSRLQVDGGTMETVSKGRIKRGRVLVALPVNAGGSARESGMISQTWLEPAGLAHSNVTSTEDAAIKTIWRGHYAGPVSVVGGVGYSYDILSPPSEIAFGLSELSLATC